MLFSTQTLTTELTSKLLGTTSVTNWTRNGEILNDNFNWIQVGCNRTEMLHYCQQSLITNLNFTVWELGNLTVPVVWGWGWLQHNVSGIGTSLDRGAPCNHSVSSICSLLEIQFVNADFWCPNGPFTKGSIILNYTWWKEDSQLLQHHVYTYGCLRKWIHI